MLKRRRADIHGAISNSTSLTTAEKAQALRQSNMNRQLQDIWREGDGEQKMTELEGQAIELARGRLERKKKMTWRGKREGEEDDEEGKGEEDDDEDDSLFDMDTDSPP